MSSSEPQGEESQAKSPSRSLGVTLVRAFVAGTLMGLPLLRYPLVDDDRFDPFQWGSEYAARPSGLVVDQLQLVRFHLIQHGNFRPLGRMLERTQDTLVFIASEISGAPIDLVLRGWFALSMGLTAVVFVLLVANLVTAGHLRDASRSRAVLLAPLTLAVLFIASGAQSPVVVFVDIYQQTMALVLLVALMASQSARFERSSVRAIELVAAGVVGLAVASFSELAALAAPLTVIVVALRGALMKALSLQELLRTNAAKLTAVGLGCFAVVFLPVRLWLAAHCAETACYAPSTARFSADLPVLFLERAVSWTPVLAWRAATVDAPLRGAGEAMSPASWVAVVLVVIVLATGIARDLRGSEPPGRRAHVSLAIAGVSLVVLGATLGAISVYVQTRKFLPGTGWRDTSVLVLGAALVLTSLLVLLSGAKQGHGHIRLAAVVCVLAAAMLIGLAANGAWSAAAAGDPNRAVYTEVAQRMVDFEATESGARARCDLVETILSVEDEGSYVDVRLETALNSASIRLHGQHFCSDRGRN